MTTFLLIRHGENDLVGHAIAGRSSGIHLNDLGRQQAQRVAEALHDANISHIVSSPLERTRETAEPLAQKLGIQIEFSEALKEIDFGDWTGKKVSELDLLPEWKQWNTWRSIGRIPHGESMWEVQARVVGEIERLRRRFPAHKLALFSHGDPIRAAITYYLGMPLDMLLRLEISSASVTTLVVDDWHVRFHGINDCV